MIVNEGGNEQTLIINHNNFGNAMKTWKCATKRKEMFELFYSN